MDPLITHELTRLDPTIPFRTTPPHTHIHHTWARTFYSRPELYIQPQSIPEIQKAVTLARRCRRRLVVVGAGHSPSDLTCTSAWLMNLDAFKKVVSVDKDESCEGSDDGAGGAGGAGGGEVKVESGISLHDLGLELGKYGLTMPNLGSIDNQSLAGAISTGTHGSSLRHGLLSHSVTGLSLVLANGQLVRCSQTVNGALFRAALLSLGALGVIVEITFMAVPDFKIDWRQSLHPLSDVLEGWDTTLWTTTEYTRVWWLPYLQRAIIWRAEKSQKPLLAPAKSFYGGRLGFHIYHNLLSLSQYLPRILPYIEWFVFGMQYGFRPGKVTTTAVQPAREGLLMDCLYSQFVNEWALPLERGPEALTRMSAWINGDETTARIPVSSKDVWVHCPIEVRVSDTVASSNASGVRPFLDPTCDHGPTLYLNATLYRPYGRDPPCRVRYYEAFEWLMQELGGRPHWAKNFQGPSSQAFSNMYGQNMVDWIKTRNEHDPEGMFIGEWHRRNLPLGSLPENSIAEREKSRRSFGKGDGVEWIGIAQSSQTEEPVGHKKLRDSTPSPPITATSEESFDYLVKGEASMHAS